MKEILEIVIEIALLCGLCVLALSNADTKIVVYCGVLYLASVIRHKK